MTTLLATSPDTIASRPIKGRGLPASSINSSAASPCSGTRAVCDIRQPTADCRERDGHFYSVCLMLQQQPSTAVAGNREEQLPLHLLLPPVHRRTTFAANLQRARYNDAPHQSGHPSPSTVAGSRCTRDADLQSCKTIRSGFASSFQLFHPN